MSHNITSNSFIKKIIKKILKPYLKLKKTNKIEFLLNNKLVISIQEHICPARDDGKKQMPNIFDDKSSLLEIFDYLRGKNVWYCTGTELAEYYYLRKNIEIIKTEKGFYFNLKKLKKKIKSLEISIELEKEAKIKLPTGEEIFSKDRIITLPLLVGNYILKYEERLIEKI